MIQNEIEVQNRYKEFIRKTCQSELIFSLKNDEGFATSYSNKTENEEDEPKTIICFWSDRARAKSCIADEWKDYRIETIDLTSFVENWCIGMSNDGLLMGINFDRNLFGFEAEPLRLILDIINELNSAGKDLKFRKFKDIWELETKVREII